MLPVKKRYFMLCWLTSGSHFLTTSTEPYFMLTLEKLTRMVSNFAGIIEIFE